MIKLPLILASLALVAGSFAVAQASIWHVAVVNDTNTCAIVTVWQQIDNGGYVLVGHGARHLKGRAEFGVPTSGPPRVDVTSVRVRAEMKENADCTGATVSDLDQREHAVRANAEYTEAAIFKSKVGYRIRFLAQ